MIQYPLRQLLSSTNKVAFRNFLEFILFSSIFIAACAVSFAIETNIILGLPLNHFGFYIFIFGATLFQYNLHYILKNKAVAGSARLAWSLKNRNLHYLLLLIGFILIIFSLTSFQLYHFYILLCLGAIAFIYSFPVVPFGKKKRLKEYGILKIITLSLLWTLVTVWFPANRMPYDPALFWFVFVKRFLFMFVLCLLFDMRDTEIDRETGIYTFPVRMGQNRSYYLAYIVLIVFLFLSGFQFVLWGNGGILIAMILSVLVTFIIIQMTKKNQSDFIFLAGIDGMMLLQALLVYVFSLK
ncbi:MAG: UbiA family prenyltransferase [Ginsengibacter sp.]